MPRVAVNSNGTNSMLFNSKMSWPSMEQTSRQCSPKRRKTLLRTVMMPRKREKLLFWMSCPSGRE